jgi:hypothetical protein
VLGNRKDGETHCRTRQTSAASPIKPERVDHEGKVIADGILVRTPMLLVSMPDGIVANDSQMIKIPVEFLTANCSRSTRWHSRHYQTMFP